jgi:cyclic pyranopterin monophosphate synthase
VRLNVKALAKGPLGGLVRFLAASFGIILEDQLVKDDAEGAAPDLSVKSARGGRRRKKITFEHQLTAAVIVLSDSRSRGQAKDESGPLARNRLESLGMAVTEVAVIPDDPEALRRLLLRFSDERKLDFIVTSGGTGLGPRDMVPEVTRDLINREIPGVSEAIRSYGQKRTRFAMLSRAVAGVRGQTLILNLPGSPAGVAESLDAVMPELLHVFKMMAGEGHA